MHAPCYKNNTMRHHIGSVLLCSGLLACSAGPGNPAPVGTTQLTAKTAETLFEENCALCHGDEGQGDGVAASLLSPKPRDFRSGMFRLVSTDNGRATKSDLARTIRRGMPGTSMPPWTKFSDDEVQRLAQYLLDLRRQALVAQAIGRGKEPGAALAWATRRSQPGASIEIPPAPELASPETLKASFVELCAACHAEDGTGKNDPSWRTEQGFPIESRNFRRGVFKGGRSDEDLYLRIAAGMPGTPMPDYGLVPPEQIWNMVRYIQSMSDPSAQDQAWVRAEVVTARRVRRMPTLDDAAWQDVPQSRLALLPLWATDQAIQSASIKAVHNRSQLAVLLEWADPQQDLGIGLDRFPDGAALQLTTDPEPPLFAMGAVGSPLEIWHWRTGAARTSSAQAEHYYSDSAGWSHESGKQFLTARAVGNPLAQGSGHAAEYTAEQLGTLRARAPDAESVRVSGSFREGRWRVMFRRSLSTKRKTDIELKAETISIAIAVWDGRLGDRNGKKSVSIWQQLVLEEGP